MAAIRSDKKKEIKRDSKVQNISIVPNKISDEQAIMMRKLQEEAAKHGRYIDCVFFN